MKWYEYIGIFVLYGTLVQFIYWLLESMKFQENALPLLSLILSNILALIVILISLHDQIQKDHKKIKKVLKELGLITEEDNLVKMLASKINGKKGEIDARVLYIFIILLLIYILWKTGRLSFLGL